MDNKDAIRQLELMLDRLVQDYPKLFMDRKRALRMAIKALKES